MKILKAADIKRIKPPTKGNERHPVDDCPCLYLKVTENDARAWTFRYRPRLGPRAGADREYTIGTIDEFGITDAKARWKALRRRVKDGEDPLEEIQQAREAPTMRDLARLYLEEVSPGKQSGHRDVEKFESINRKLGAYKVAAVDYQAIHRWHRSMKAKPVAANRALSVIKDAFNHAIKLEWRKDNPAALVKRFSEKPRERYLTDEEYPRLFAALAACSHQVIADIIRFLLTTGARRGDVADMKWTDVHLKKGIWHKPTTKAGHSHRVALNAPAREIIARQPRNSEYVFASKNGRRLYDIKDTWADIRKAAGIEDVHLHDLRHSAASLLASDGESLKIIGEILGHRDAGSTARYSHVDLRASRAAADRLGRKLTEFEKPKGKPAESKRGA